MEKIQSKLIQLSLEIEDKVRYIALLQDAINQANQKHEIYQKEAENKYRNSFRARSTEAKTRYSEVIEKCNGGLEEKKSATIQLNKSSVTKKKIVQEQKKKIEKIAKEKKREMEKERIQWKAEAKTQREMWLEKKGRDIREITIKGLEPEVKLIVQKHKSLYSQIQAENEAVKQNLTINIQSEFTTKLKYVQEENESRRSKNIDEARMILRRKLDEEYERQAKTLAKIRDQFSREVDSQRKWYKDELRKLTDFYASEIDCVKSTTEKRLLDIDDTFLKEKHQIVCIIDNEIQKIEAKVDDNNKEWINNIKEILEVERIEAIAKERKKFEEERDDILDTIIRKNQREISLLSESIYNDYNNETESFKSMHEKALRIASESLDSWNKKHQLHQKEIYSVQKDKQKIRQDIEIKGENIREIREKVQHLENILQKKKMMFMSQLDENKNDTEIELMTVEQELADLNNTSNTVNIEAESKMRKHDQMKKELEKTQNDRMEQLEQELKRAIDINNSKRRDIFGQIKEEELHIEHMRLIAKSYGNNITRYEEI